MLAVEIALQGPAQALTGGQKSSMFSRAVVLQGAVCPRRAGATQQGHVHIRPPEHLEGLAGLLHVAIVGGAGNRQGPLATALGIGGTTGHKDLGLEGFEPRTNEAELLGIPRPHQQPPPLVTNHRMDPMQRFGNAIAQQSHLQWWGARPEGSTAADR